MARGCRFKDRKGKCGIEGWGGGILGRECEGGSVLLTMVAYLHLINVMLCIDCLPIFSTRHC